MTDKDIIKVYEYCITGHCDHFCPRWNDTPSKYVSHTRCRIALRREMLEVAKRQQAELERLIDLINEIGEYNEAWVKDNHDLRVELKTSKADAIREFAERLHKNARTFREYWEAGVNCVTFAVEIEDIDNLVKEMTEDKA